MMIIIVLEYLVSEPFRVRRGKSILHIQREINTGKEGVQKNQKVI